MLQNVKFQPTENVPYQLINCPLIECSRYVVVRRCFDICAFDRMHCLMRIEFSEGREIYYIAHTRKYSDSGEYFCVLPLLTTTENVKFSRIFHNGMNPSHSKESNRKKRSKLA